MPSSRRTTRRHGGGGRYIRAKRGGMTHSLDMHKFKLKLTNEVETDAGGLVRMHLQPYSLSSSLNINNVGTQSLEEVGNIKQLFDSYRVESVKITWIPYFNVNAPANLATGTMPPFYILFDPDDSGLAAQDKNAFITHKTFKMKQSGRKWTYTFKPPRKVGVTPAGALLTGGFMNVQG